MRTMRLSSSPSSSRSPPPPAPSDECMRGKRGLTLDDSSFPPLSSKETVVNGEPMGPPTWVPMRPPVREVSTPLSVAPPGVREEDRREYDHLSRQIDLLLACRERLKGEARLTKQPPMKKAARLAERGSPAIQGGPPSQGGREKRPKQTLGATGSRGSVPTPAKTPAVALTGSAATHKRRERRKRAAMRAAVKTTVQGGTVGGPRGVRGTTTPRQSPNVEKGRSLVVEGRQREAAGWTAVERRRNKGRFTSSPAARKEPQRQPGRGATARENGRGSVAALPRGRRDKGESTHKDSQRGPGGRTNIPAPPRPPRSAAITIVAPPGTCAEVMRSVTSAISLMELGIAGLRTRRALDGALLLEVPGAGAAERANRLAAAIMDATKEREGVRIRRPTKMAGLRLRGLPDYITLGGWQLP